MPRPKGIKQILSERGLWRKNMVGECRLCRDGNTDPLEERLYLFNRTFWLKDRHWLK